MSGAPGRTGRRRRVLLGLIALFLVANAALDTLQRMAAADTVILREDPQPALGRPPFLLTLERRVQ